MKLAARIREAMAGGAPLSVMDVAERMGSKDYAEVDRIRHALMDMATRGVVERVEREPLYRLAEGQIRGGKQAKIWKAVVIRGAKGITAKEAAMLAAADFDYVKRYLRWLDRERHIHRIGLRGSKSKVYRIAAGREKMAAPQWNRRAEDRRRRHEQEAEAGPGEQAEKRGADQQER